MCGKFHDYIEKFKFMFDRRVPLVGHVVYCDRDDHWSTLSDVLNYLVWATMPFWLGALILLVTATDGEHDWARYFAFLISTLDKGELLILSTSLLAPAFSVSLIDPKQGESTPFPGKLSHATVVAVLMVVCASLFAVQRVKAEVSSGLLFELSVYATGISLCLFYIATLYNHNRGPDALGKIRTDEENFSAQYERHRAET